MDETMMSGWAALADAFGYPAPGGLEALKAGLSVLSNAASKKAYTAFIDAVSPLSTGEWEELYTRTLDLNPPAAPYIGYQIWGESYQRGAFLARLNREMIEAGVHAGGELPDHLAPVLRYLGRAQMPLPELLELCDPALQRMISTLRQTDPGNPYVKLLEAVAAVCQDLTLQVPANGKEEK